MSLAADLGEREAGCLSSCRADSLLRSSDTRAATAAPDGLRRRRLHLPFSSRPLSTSPPAAPFVAHHPTFPHPSPRHYPLFSVHENHIVFRVVKRRRIICYWRILGTLAKVANRIPRWDATEGILWGNLMACPAWKVGLATCTASPWPSKRFHDGKRIAG